MPLTLAGRSRDARVVEHARAERTRGSRPESRRVENAVARPTDAAAPRAVRPDRSHLARGGRARVAAPEPAAHRRASARAADAACRPARARRSSIPSTRPRSRACAISSSIGSRSRAPSVANISPADTLNPFVLAAGDGTLHAAATSPQYEDLLETDVSPALRAQRLLAALSVARVRARRTHRRRARGTRPMGARRRDRDAI